MHSQLAGAIARAGTIVIDASAVKRIDAASLQLLAAFVYDRTSRGRGVAWKSPAPVIESAARKLGLLSLLALSAGPTAP